MARVKKSSSKKTAQKTVKTPKTPRSIRSSASSAVSTAKKATKARVPRKPRAHKVVNVEPPSRFKRVVLSKTFGQLFAIGSVLVLFLTIIFWSLLSARLQQMNADQLSDAYLFQNGAVFKGAGFPSAHTFYLKWPLFYAMKLLGNTPFVFALATVFFVAITVAVLVFILYRIERRPLVFGCICLALASVLLLIPAQPYPGALLPVNLAMTTTRNIEYAVYIVAIYCMLRAARLRSNLFAIGCVLMIILAASDTLFATLGIGGAVLALCLQRFLQWRKADARPFLRWVIGSLLGAVMATLLLTALNNRGITHISQGNNISPYGAVRTFHQLLEAMIFGVGAFLTNLGANPVHGLLVLKDGPSQLAHALTKASIIPYAANFVLAGFGLWSVYRVLRVGIHDTWTRLSLALIWSSIVAFGVFVATDHYYPVDARYVSIVMFTLFISSAVYVRSRDFSHKTLFSLAIILLCVIPLGIATTWHEYGQGRAALSTQDQMSHRVASILEKDHINHLMGDYWSVLPIKAYSEQNFTVLPVSPCSLPRTILASSVYFQLRRDKPVAFLATRDGSTDNFVGCTIQEIHSTYGDPTTTTVVSGTSKRPSAILYTYSQGFGHIKKHNDPVVRFVPDSANTAQPLTALPAAKCAGKTIVNVVAHEDDDLLFMNPDLLNNIHDGKCIVTVYLTTGDAGNDQTYWVGRQAGSEAAYSFMYAAPNIWNEQYALLDGKLVTTDSMASNDTMQMIFLHLPDGGLHGSGFQGSLPDSMNGLRTSAISALSSKDGLSTYTQADIINSLSQLYALEKPTEIHTQDYSNDLADGDHSDHHAAGFFAQEAFKSYDGTATIRAYAGYPMKMWPVNVRDGDATQKLLTFLVYAGHDSAVCQTIDSCRATNTYGSYLVRQYSRVVATHQAQPVSQKPQTKSK